MRDNLQILELELVLPQDIKIKQSAGSLLHGVLMEAVDPFYAEEMHGMSLRPYSQYVYFDRERQRLIWRLASLNRQAEQELLMPAYELPREIYLRQKGFALTVARKSFLQATSYEKLLDKYFVGAPSLRGVEYTFLTSTGFKNNREYVIYPQTHLIFNSLLRKWNQFTDNIRLDERGLAYDLAQYAYVRAYDLRLNPFSVDASVIPAFRGKLTLGFKNNVMVQKIICVLSDYAEYAGVGIKTALGMGAVRSRIILGNSKEEEQ